MAASDFDSNEIYRSGGPLTPRVIFILLIVAGALYAAVSVLKPH